MYKIGGIYRIGITERGDAGLDYSWTSYSSKFAGLILITKHLSDRFIHEVAKVNCIVHSTITGHGGSIYEPNVPDLITSKIYFDKLIDTIGTDRVVLRIDPIIPDQNGLYKALHVYNKFYLDEIKKTRVRISFMDNYNHVKERFKKAGLKPFQYYFHAPLELRKKIASFFPEAEICGEPGFDCVGCISEKDLKILGIEEKPVIGGWQRKECKCLTNKIEILKNRSRCQHGCIYCYWK